MLLFDDDMIDNTNDLDFDADVEAQVSMWGLRMPPPGADQAEQAAASGTGGGRWLTWSGVGLGTASGSSMPEM